MLFFQISETLTVVSNCGRLESVEFCTIIQALSLHSRLSPCEPVEDPIMQTETHKCCRGTTDRGLEPNARSEVAAWHSWLVSPGGHGKWKVSRSSTNSEVIHSRTGLAVMLK